MYFVYLLKNKSFGSYYIGQTNNIAKRVIEHNKGLDKFTKPFLPWQLVYFEAYVNRTLAIKVRNSLKDLLKLLQS